MARFPTEAPAPTLPVPDPAGLAANVKAIAAALGFDDCRIAAAAEARHAAAFDAYLDEGRHGEMHWLAKDPARRRDPRRALPGCRSVIVLAFSYAVADADNGLDPPVPAPDGGARGLVSRYARGEDYHRLAEGKVADLVAGLEAWGGLSRGYVDTGPVLERNWAAESGLGWGGKSTVQIHRRLGAWFFLATVLTTLELAPDSPERDRCGSCTRCLAACPTQAIVAPRRLDPRRCISYLTIEHPGPIPEEFRAAIGARIFGCDDCLAACPWNKFAARSRHLRLAPRPHWRELSLRELLDRGPEHYRWLARHSPLARTKWPRFARNLCVALGNTGDAADLPALERAAACGDDLVAEHARWAIARIRARPEAPRLPESSPAAPDLHCQPPRDAD